MIPSSIPTLQASHLSQQNVYVISAVGTVNTRLIFPEPSSIPHPPSAIAEVSIPSFVPQSPFTNLYSCSEPAADGSYITSIDHMLFPISIIAELASDGVQSAIAPAATEAPVDAKLPPTLIPLGSRALPAAR